MYIGQGRIGGWLPLNSIITLVVLLIIGYVLQKTYIGRQMYAVGDNPEAARLAGLNVWPIKYAAYILAGILVGITAILLTARSGSADSTMGPDLTFTGITPVFWVVLPQRRRGYFVESDRCCFHFRRAL